MTDVDNRRDDQEDVVRVAGSPRREGSTMQLKVLGSNQTQVTLADGLNTVQAYLDRVLPLAHVRDARIALLPPVYTITSQRVHLVDEHTYSRAEMRIDLHGVSPVTFTSNTSSGRMDQAIESFSAAWQRACAVINPIFDRHDRSGAWESLTEDQFDLVRAALWDIYNEQVQRDARLAQRYQQERDRARRAYWAKA